MFTCQLSQVSALSIGLMVMLQGTESQHYPNKEEEQGQGGSGGRGGKGRAKDREEAPEQKRTRTHLGKPIPPMAVTRYLGCVRPVPRSSSSSSSGSSSSSRSSMYRAMKYFNQL